MVADGLMACFPATCIKTHIEFWVSGFALAQRWLLWSNQSMGDIYGYDLKAW